MPQYRILCKYSQFCNTIYSTRQVHTKKEFSISTELFVEIVGVEPTTPCLQSRCSSQLSYTPRIFKNFVVPSRLELLTPTLSV